jgi:hypothetical protein
MSPGKTSTGFNSVGAVPAGLADVEVKTDAGALVKLSSTWANRPVALVFTRHFG